MQSDFEYTKSDLVLHVSMRYSDGQGFIVINSKNENGWMEEQMHRNICFEPGVDFELLILSDFDKFQVGKCFYISKFYAIRNTYFITLLNAAN